MTYAFRGGDRLSLLAAFEGGRRDPDTGKVVNPVVTGWTTMLRRKGLRAQVGLSIPPTASPVVFCQGRLVRLLDLDERLADPTSLVAGEAAARTFAERLGIPVHGLHATVRRCDPASDVRFRQPADGAAFLRAVRSLVLPTLKSSSHGIRGQAGVGGVDWKNGAGLQLRAYDKSRAYGSRRGSVVRLERQWRPGARDQRTPEALAPQDLATIFASPFRRSTFDGLVVASPVGAYAVLKERLGWALPGNQTLTPRIAERMLGTLMMLLVEGDDAFDSPRKARERRAQLRAVRIEVDEQSDSIIDIGGVFDAAIGSWSQDVGSDRAR